MVNVMLYSFFDKRKKTKALLIAMWPVFYSAFFNDCFDDGDDNCLYYWFLSNFIQQWNEVSSRAIVFVIIYCGAISLFVFYYSGAQFIKTKKHSKEENLKHSEEIFGFKYPIYLKIITFAMQIIILALVSYFIIKILSINIYFLNNWGAREITIYTVALAIASVACASSYLAERAASVLKLPAFQCVGLASGVLAAAFFYQHPKEYPVHRDNLENNVRAYIKEPSKQKFDQIGVLINLAKNDGVIFYNYHLEHVLMWGKDDYCYSTVMKKFSMLSNPSATGDNSTSQELPPQKQIQCDNDVSNIEFSQEAYNLKMLIQKLGDSVES